MLDIYYVLNNRFPTIKAYGLQVAKTCEGFKKNGARVRLVVPLRKRHKEIYGINTFDLYGIKEKFRIVYLPSFDFTWLGLDNKLFFFIQQIFFGLLAAVYLLRKKGIIYSRDPFALYFLSFVKGNLYWEVHRFPENLKNRLYRQLLLRVSGLVVITKSLRGKFIENGYPENKILVSPDGIDMDEFDVKESRDESRMRLGLPAEKTIVMYSGQLFEWKGADIFAKAASKLGDKYFFIIVGGTDEDLAKIRKIQGADRVQFEGFKPHYAIPRYLNAADILILPNIKDAGISEFYTSPLKMFEYMASGKPIVASDLSSIREVLNEENAVLFEAGNADSLAKAIENISSDRQRQIQISELAKADARSYTWDSRTGKILNFIKY